MRKFWTYYLLKWQDVLEYRSDMVMYAISQSLLPIIGLLLWLSLQSTGVHLKLDNTQLIQYFLFAFIVSNLTASWKSWFLSEEIKSGVFSNYLLKPMSLESNTLADVFAQKTFRVMILMPTVIILGSVLLGLENVLNNISAVSFVLFLISICFSILISFYLDMLIGISSFWFHEVDFLNGINGLITILLSGKLIPIMFLPPFLYNLSIYLPFRYMVSFPIEILLNIVQGETLFIGLSIQVLWLIILCGAYKVFYMLGKKVYEGYGG